MAAPSKLAQYCKRSCQIARYVLNYKIYLFSILHCLCTKVTVRDRCEFIQECVRDTHVTVNKSVIALQLGLFHFYCC